MKKNAITITHTTGKFFLGKSEEAARFTVDFGVLKDEWEAKHGEGLVVFTFSEEYDNISGYDDIFNLSWGLKEIYNNFLMHSDKKKANDLFNFIDEREEMLEDLITLDEYNEAKAIIEKQKEIIANIEQIDGGIDNLQAKYAHLTDQA